MAGTELVPYTGPDRRTGNREHRFELRRRDALARALTPLWFVTLLVGLYGVSSWDDRRVPYAVAGVALVGTLGSTWLLSRTAYRWQFRRKYRWLHPMDHWRAHVAYRNFKEHYPVVVAWHDVFVRRQRPDAIGGSRQEDRPESDGRGGRRGRRGRSRPAPQHGWPDRAD